MSTRHLPILGGHPRTFGGTLRRDAWRTGPIATVAMISCALAYLTWAMFQGNHYYAAPYLSPIYSPVLFAKLDVPGAAPLEHAWLGAWPAWWPAFALLPASPGFLILPFPGLFRFTCYYYRKAYYRSFGGSPPGCAVSPGQRPPYHGETRFFLFQNLHRYALYIALLYVLILGYDALQAFFKHGQLGIGVGTIVLCVNTALIASYTFGCHSFRHLIGGRVDCMSDKGHSSGRLSTWKGATWFNARHMNFAWASLAWVAFTDIYVRLVSHGVIVDLNTWQ
ncbi:MAG: succinate dehydrogenase [Deltaproteobacteria bacterium]